MIIVWILAFALTITIHEAAHAWMANRLGDPTARLLGRLTLNPIKHIDPIGSILVPFLTSLTGFIFGWAKPVPVDPYNLANPKKDSALISLAGPLVNIALATILAIVIKIFKGEIIFNLLYPVILLNITLAIFNLIPIHPLDGGKILIGLLPNKEAQELDMFLNKYGMFLLFAIIFPFFGGTSLVSSIITPVINIIVNLLVPGIASI